MVDRQGAMEGPSWADIWKLREQGLHRPPPQEREEEGGYSYDEVMEEIRLIVADTARLLAEDPRSEMDALAGAELIANLRDNNRLRARYEVPLGDFAMVFAGWLIRRADRGDFSAAVQAALLAANGSAEEPVLGGELREFVRGDLDGSISDEEVTRQQKHPRAKLRKEAAAATAPGDPLASDAAATLRGMLAEASAKADGLATWEVFKRFSEVPCEPEAPERLDERAGDLVLFEWGVSDWPWSDAAEEVFLVDLVRQFGVIGEDGEYERMEQVHCSIRFDPVPDLRELARGAIWSDGDVAAWSAEVELSNGFAAMRTASPKLVHVEHERL